MDSLVTANVRQRPVRAFVSAAGVALGVCLVMMFTGLARGMSSDMQRRSQSLKAEIIFTRSGGDNLLATTANTSVKYVDLLKQVDGVATAVPEIRFGSQSGNGFGFEQVEGVDWPEYAAMNDMTIVAGRAPRLLDESGKPGLDEVVIDQTKAKDYKLSPGSQLVLFGRNDHPYKVVGIYSPEVGPRIKMSLAAMQDAIEAPDKCTLIYVKVKDPARAVEVARRIMEQLPGNNIQMTRDIVTSFEKSIPFLGVFLRTLVGLSAIVSMLVVMLAMYTTITERTREIGILKALGASRAFIVAEIEKEAVLISAIGLVAGFLVSLAAGYLIQNNSGLVFEFSWTWALTAAVIGLVGGALGALYPAVRAANLDAVSALAYE
jgi:putative ABC transport system permease protein